MPDDELKYDSMVEEALRSVVGKALTHVAEHGLPGNHHFYITFRTDHPGVAIPDHLHERYPSEMTIVLQYQFWGLEIGPETFSVTLSFADVPERLTIPFKAVVAFADPSVRFRLQFDTGEGARSAAGAATPLSGAADQSEAEAANAARNGGPGAREGEPAGPGAREGEPAGPGEGEGEPAGPGEGEGEPAGPGRETAEAADKVVTLDAFRKK